MERSSFSRGAGFAAIWVGVLFLGLGSARAELRILVPAAGAIIAESPAPLIGTGIVGDVEVLLNGKKFAVEQAGGSFSGTLPLVLGENTLAVTSGDKRLELHLSYEPKVEKGRYLYHEPVMESDCRSCHLQGLGQAIKEDSKSCWECHDRKDTARYIHGPIGAGQCSICHDPHGSSRKALLTAEVRDQCRSCHGQINSSSHADIAGSRQCPECHDPHGSGKKYLLY